MKNPFLIGDEIYLRAAETGDEEIWAETENHPDPREHLFYALPTSPEEQLAKLEQAIIDHNTVLFTICAKETDKAFGVTAFYRIDWVGRMATFYIAIAPKDNWSKGYGKEVTKLMIDYAFDTLNLNRVQLHVYTGNERAIKAYQKCGFQIEGTLREAMYHKGHYCDFYIMGILRKER